MKCSGGRSRPLAPEAGAATPTIDMEGLVCAFLDDSGRIGYYFDTESGEVIDVRDGSALAPPRYRRVPARSERSEADDRKAFAAKHVALAYCVGSGDDFRRVWWANVPAAGAYRFTASGDGSDSEFSLDLGHGPPISSAAIWAIGGIAALALVLTWLRARALPFRKP